MVSPEEPPTVNYAAVRSFPLFPSLTRGPSLSAAEAEAGASLGRACALAGRRYVGWPSCGRVVFRFCFIYLFHRFMYILKNM